MANPRVSNTAARYVAKAMCAVAPDQRAEVLLAVIAHAQAGLEQLRTGTVVERVHDLTFAERARELLGLDLEAA
jgi:hypothetical protein